MKLPDSAIANIPTVLYGTINGSIGVIASLPQEQFAVLAELQTVLESYVKGVGGFDHQKWRSYDSPFSRSQIQSSGFLDGDLIEQVLELSAEDVAKITELMGDPAKAANAINLVGDLARLH